MARLRRTPEPDSDNADGGMNDRYDENVAAVKNKRAAFLFVRAFRRRRGAGIWRRFRSKSGVYESKEFDVQDVI
jgi:hypothetical protein